MAKPSLGNDQTLTCPFKYYLFDYDLLQLADSIFFQVNRQRVFIMAVKLSAGLKKDLEVGRHRGMFSSHSIIISE